MKFYDNDRDEVLNSLNTSPSGLSSTEARRRLEEGGPNKLKEAKKTPLIIRFLEQLKDPMIIILLIAAIVSGVVSVMTNESFADTIIIIVVVLLNATLGVLQESKAEKAIEALQAMSRAQSRVMRDGVIRVVKSEDLVIGDIVLLEAGDAVPADGRIIECASLQIEEAALTGESVPVTKQAEALPAADKDVPLGDRVNMCYMGSTVAYGRGYAVITATGMDTEMGKIADALTKAEAGKTPLQKKLGQLSRILTYAVVGICIFMFAFSLLTAGKGNIDTAFVLDTFMIAVSLAVAAIPEGLATVVTISLSIGVTKMSKRNAVIRKLTAVETLGCTEIICSDKTGTLTLNRMTVVRTASIGDGMVDALNMSGDLTPSGKLLCTAMSLCSDAEPDENDIAVGEPTECALVNFATLVGLDKRKLKEQYPRIGEAPFDSVRKLMTTVHSFDGDVIQFTKGAPDELLKRCTMYFDGEKAVPMTDAIRERILADNKAMADDALRALAAAMRTWDDRPASMTPSFLEQNLTFIGIVGMIDPVRPEAIEAVRQCRSAGIRPIMITGDHRDTAAAIAKQIGIITDSSEVLTGAELSEMSDEELDACIEKYGAYARVQPEHKVRIVTAWQKRGKVTAMTGDGVNDAAGIKTADIGVGMGITGTDVTKNVADMVLADDNFATIVTAVSEGRRIYDNIRKAIQFLLGSNLSEVLSVFFASVMNFTILQAPHLLFINLVTDCFPALALGLEKPESDIMRRKPRLKDDGIFAGGLGIDCFYQGILVTVLTVIAFYTGEFLETGKLVFRNIQDSSEGMTMAFFTMSMCEIFHSFNMRSQRGSSVKLVFTGSHNKALYLAMAASLLLTTAVVEIDFLSNLFGFAHLDTKAYLISLFLAFLIIPIVELVKAIQRRTAKK